MRFVHMLCFASLALSIPQPVPQEGELALPALAKRDDISNIITFTIATLENATLSNVNAVAQALQIAQSSVGAEVLLAIQANIKANYNAIAQALQTAVGNIERATGGALEGIVSQFEQLVQAEVERIIAGLQGTVQLLKNISVVVNVTVSNLTPALKSALSAEVSAVQSALSSFIQPLSTLVSALQKASVTTGVGVSGLAELATGLTLITASLLIGL